MEFVKIIHPNLGPEQITDVPDTSLREWYAAGWHLLAEDEAPQPEPEPEPPPMTRAQAAKAAKQAAKESEEK